MASTPTPPRAWAGLVVLLLPALLTSMDISILFVAGPAISHDLAPSAGQWLWMMDIYSFVLAGLLITMGDLGDRIGRRRLLLLGAVLFGVGSAGLTFAPSPEWFIAGRALLGVGAATLAPSTLALIRTMFAGEDHRRAAVGAWTVAFSGGAVAGPIVGGLLLEHFWWGSVFLVNVPVMALLVVTVPYLVPESRAETTASFDGAGAVLSLVGIIALVNGGKLVPEQGAAPSALLSLVLGVVFLVWFVVRQRRAANPLLDLSLFRQPAFGVAVASNLVVSVVMAGLGLLAFTFLQTVHGMEPLRAALVALPTFAGTFLGAAAASAAATRLRPHVLVVGGFLVSATGMATIGVVGPDTPVPVFIAGYTTLTFGIGCVSTLASSLVLDHAPPERAGSAASVSETGITLGDALGIALFGTVSAAVYRGLMAREDVGAGSEAQETVVGALAHAWSLPPEQGSVLLRAAFESFTSGMTTVALAASALLAVTAVLVGTVLGRRPSTRPAVSGPRR
ncbi:MFS transporter [Actinoalloteichus spitiensis]|uniref:MFS transporter n=1 Tax=Actinoalloteichus spitiensis TaxID=252394 RepID=UPI00035CB487|nr:MFS transporter [Actinoalloteichus spitiensis]